MNAPRIQSPESAAHDAAVADLLAAESKLADALVWAEAATLAEPIRADIARLRIEMRALLQYLS